MSADDAVRPELVLGHGAPPDSDRPGSGSGGRTNLDAAMRSRAEAIDWAAVWADLSPEIVEFEAEKKRRRREREGQAS